MFPYQIVRNPLSLSKIIGGISKTLSIANQMIPLYQQAKPMIANARNAFALLKTPPVKNSNKKEVRIPTTTSPKFFL